MSKSKIAIAVACAAIAASLAWRASSPAYAYDSGAPTIPTFATQNAAQQHCPQDDVVWLNTDSGIYFLQGDRLYGESSPGAYVCRKDADGAGYHPPAPSGKNALLAPAASPTPEVGNAIFQTLVPLASEDRVYDCDGGEVLTVSARPYESAGRFKITQTWTNTKAAIAPTSFVTEHDASNDTMIDGFFDSAGKFTPQPAPVLAVPLKPSAGFEVEMPLATGSTYPRKWYGSSTVDVPFGHFAVEVYSDKFPAYTELDAFADNVGIAQYELLTKDGKPFLTCGLTSVTMK